MVNVRDKLATSQTNALEQSQINDAAGVIYVSDRMQLNNALTIAEQTQKIRSFGSWPDPGGGSSTTGSGTTHDLRPDEGAEWVVFAVDASNGTGGTAAVSVVLYDHTNTRGTILLAQDVPAGQQAALALPYPVIVTNTLGIRVTSDASVTVNFAYQNAVQGTG